MMTMMMNELWIGHRHTLEHELMQQMIQFLTCGNNDKGHPSPSSSSSCQKKILYICSTDLLAHCRRNCLEKLEFSSTSTTSTTSPGMLSCTVLSSSNSSNVSSLHHQMHQMMNHNLFFTTFSHIFSFFPLENHFFKLEHFDLIIVDEVMTSDGTSGAHNGDLNDFESLLRRMEEWERKFFARFSVIALSSRCLSSFQDENVDFCVKRVEYWTQLMNRNGIVNPSCKIRVLQSEKWNQSVHEVAVSQNLNMIWAISTILIEFYEELKQFVKKQFGLVSLHSLLPVEFDTLGSNELNVWLHHLQDYCLRTDSLSMVQCVQVMYECHVAYRMIHEEVMITRQNGSTSSSSSNGSNGSGNDVNVGIASSTEQLKNCIVSYLNDCLNRMPCMIGAGDRLSVAQQQNLNESWIGATQSSNVMVSKNNERTSNRSFLQYVDSSIRDSIEQQLREMMQVLIDRVKGCPSELGNHLQNDRYRQLVQTLTGLFSNHISTHRYSILVLVTHRQTVDRIHGELARHFSEAPTRFSIEKMERFSPHDYARLQQTGGSTVNTNLEESRKVVVTTRLELEKICVLFPMFLNEFNTVIHYDAPSAPYYIDVTHSAPTAPSTVPENGTAQSSEHSELYLYHSSSLAHEQYVEHCRKLELLRQEAHRSSYLSSVTSSQVVTPSRIEPPKRKRTVDTVSVGLDEEPQSKRLRTVPVMTMQPSGTFPSSPSSAASASSSAMIHPTLRSGPVNNHNNNSAAASNIVQAHLALGEDISSKMNQIITGEFKTTPQYDIRETFTDGLAHTFEAVMTFYSQRDSATWKAYGQGRNKREAKRAAAQDMFRQYLERKS